MRLIIAGSRGFATEKHYTLLKEHCNKFLEQYEEIIVICGGATGADSLGKKWAEENNLSIEMFIPEWHKDGRYNPSAGLSRNRLMAKSADRLIAFWDGQSRGTENMINNAVDYNLDFSVVEYR